jgi:hypothetical protein
VKIFVLILIFGNSAKANWDKIENDRLTTKFGYGATYLTTELKAPETISTKKVQYQPNVPSKLLVGLSYRTIGLTIGLSGTVPENVVQEKGKTEQTDYILRFMGQQTFEFHYQRYKGLYIENSEEIDGTYAGSANRIQRPDIITSKFGMNYFYNFREKDFSLNVAFDQGGRPKSPGWSYFLFGAAAHNDFKGESALIPSQVSSSFGDLSQVQGIDVNTATAGMGIGGMTNWAGLYFTGLLSFGFGYQEQKVASAGNIVENFAKTGYSSSLRLGMGFNSGNHLFTIQMLGDNVSATIKEGQISAVTWDFGVYYGFRWDGVNIPFLNPLADLF